MNTATVTLIIAILELCLRYGKSAAMAAIAALGKEEITLEDIQALRIEKEPEEFVPNP